MSLHRKWRAALWVAVACAVSGQADPPKELPKDQPAVKANATRPTTKEEFAALAKAGPKPPWLPFTNQRKVLDQIIDGTVVGVSADVIEIRPEGKKQAVKYPPHTLLATGAVCHWVSDAHCYLLDDVREGDVVMLSVGTVDEEKGPECFFLKIRERPDGAVPPSRKPSETKPYHVQREYELYFERRGQPTPEEIKTAAEKWGFLIEKGVPLKAGGATETPPKK